MLETNDIIRLSKVIEQAAFFHKIGIDMFIQYAKDNAKQEAYKMLVEYKDINFGF